MPSLESSFSLNAEDFFNVVKSLPRGTGTGPSGWRFEHLKVLLEDEVTADGLFTACSLMARGDLPLEIAKLLSASRLIALPKCNGDVRPIAIGECLRCITARVICRQKREAFADYFCPMQHGVSTPSGSELVAHHIKLLLERNNDWVAIKTDVKNAFNSISRKELLQQCRSTFQDISKHVYQMYFDFSSLVALQNGQPVLLQSEVGVHQGDPLGPALFAMAIHPTLVDLQNTFSNIQILAYLDDVFLVGLPNDVMEAFTSLQCNFSAIGLDIACQKCKSYCPSPAIKIPDCQLPVTPEGIVILGMPLGNAEFVSNFCSTYANTGEQLCDQLSSLKKRFIIAQVLSCSTIELLSSCCSSNFTDICSRNSRFTDTQSFL